MYAVDTCPLSTQIQAKLACFGFNWGHARYDVQSSQYGCMEKYSGRDVRLHNDLEHNYRM